MNRKSTRKLRKSDLLELLKTQAEENKKLRSRLEKAEKELADRSITLAQCGSIAEASLKLNGVFESAQKAADEYLENVKSHSENSEEIYKRQEDEARVFAQRIIAEAEKKCRIMEEEASKKCDKMISIAKKESEKYWESVSKKIEERLKQQDESNLQSDF